MRLLYMGTAAAEGWPGLFCSCPICTHARAHGGRNLRTRTQALLDGEILLDFPPDSYCHALRYGLDLGKIHTLLVTHSHMDHWFPTDLIHRHEHFGHGAQGVLDVYGNSAVEKAFYDHIRVDRFKPHRIDDVVRFHHIHGGDRFRAGGWEITAVPADHDKREECLVYLCQKEGKTVFYGHDTGANLSPQAWELLKKVRLDLVSLDATMGCKTIGGYHMGLLDIEPFLRALEEMGSIDGHTVRVINHFSHNGGMTQEELERWGAQRGILAAYDGMEVSF